MKIVVSGASGDLGSRVTRLLLDTVDPASLILLSRNPGKIPAAGLRGAAIRRADFNDPDTLPAALAGGELMLLISTLSIGRRVQQHGNAITAAKQAGIKHIIYTSSLGVQPQNPSISAQEHYATEQMLRDSGLTFTLLRNSWYADVIPTLMLPTALATGGFVGSTGEGHVAPVYKQDCARVAAAILTDPDKHANAVYEITGPDLINFSDIARICSELSGRSLSYTCISHAQQLANFDAMGVSRDYAEDMMNEATQSWPSNEMVSYEMAIRQHFFAICSHHVLQITGAAAKPFREVIEHYHAAWQEQL
ncbi:MAG: SDR family oxidoreductase [Pseudomonadales bacterium]|nr:SDR family oxidoreductase [Pseudomonadales bacterium]